MAIKANQNYRHLKTGTIYVVEEVDIVNATNAQNGQRMVKYRRSGTNDGDFPRYVREEAEFALKFVETEAYYI